MTVSVVLATYNGERFLTTQLESIARQSRPIDQLVVVDDGSNDATADIVQSFRSSFVDLELIPPGERRLGFVANFERGLSLCRGEQIFLSDQDDVWYVDKVERLSSALEDSAMVLSDARVVGANGRLIASSFHEYAGIEAGADISVEQLIRGPVVTGCLCAISREALELALPFPPGLAEHDYWLSLCAATIGRLRSIPETLTDHRRHESNAIGPRAFESRLRRFSRRWSEIRGNGIREVVSRIRTERRRHLGRLSLLFEPRLEVEEKILCCLRSRIGYGSALLDGSVDRIARTRGNSQECAKVFGGRSSRLKDRVLANLIRRTNNNA